MMQKRGRLRKPLVELERAKGFEPSTQNAQSSQAQGVPQVLEPDHTQIRAQISGPSDADLAQIVEAWPTLSQPLKAAMLAIVRTVCGDVVGHERK